MCVVLSARENLPEVVVGNTERRFIRRVGEPRREVAVASASVMHASGVESAQTGRHVQALKRYCLMVFNLNEFLYVD